MLSPLATLWIRGDLGYLERLCLTSMVALGHRVTLYSYGPVGNVPQGVDMADGNDILPEARMIVHRKTGSPALFANLFRYVLMKETADIWVDTDIYLRKPLQVQDGYCVGRESENSINNAVLRLPPDSATLDLLLDFTAQEHPVPPWYPERRQRKLRGLAAKGRPLTAGDLKWGVFGPQALTWFLQQTGEDTHALAPGVLYPVPYRNYKDLLRPTPKASHWITPETRAIHFWGKEIRRKLQGKPPAPDSILGRLLAEHAIKVPTTTRRRFFNRRVPV